MKQIVEIPKTAERNSVVIVHGDVVTGLGSNLEELWQGIFAGKTAIKPVSRFPVNHYTSKVAACIDDLKPRRGQSLIRSLVDRLLRDMMGSVPHDVFLITATTKAGIDTIELLRRGQSADDKDTLLYSLAQRVANTLGLTHRGININAACASSTIALARGASMIVTGRADAVLVCCADIITEFVFSGFSALKALSPVPCMPFAGNRRGLSLGDGAAVLLLMSGKRASQEKRRPLGRILGWGISNDAIHITAPDRTGGGLVSAISQALKTAGCKPEEITAVNAHGTGTVYNDLMEITAFNKVFGPRKVPIYSVKGAVGHTLGAAGGIEAVLGLKTLLTQIVPPTTGCINPEKRVIGQVSSREKPISGDYLLTTNSGFGGVNAALVLAK